jgi:hypothetical protein
MLGEFSSVEHLGDGRGLFLEECYGGVEGGALGLHRYVGNIVQK